MDGRKEEGSAVGGREIVLMLSNHFGVVGEDGVERSLDDLIVIEIALGMRRDEMLRLGKPMRSNEVILVQESVSITREE